MKRWRDSITTTIALTVIVAMLLGFSLQRLVSSGLLYIGLAPQQTLQIGNSQPFQQLPGRIAALLDVLDGTPGAERPVVIAAAQRPSIRIRLLDAPMPNLVNRGEPDADLLRRRIEAVLTVPRPVVVVNAYGPANQQAGAVDGRVQNGMFVEAALSDGHWLFFTTPLIPPPAVDPVATKFSRASFTAWLALSIALGILLSMLAARRLIICQDASDVGEPVTFSGPRSVTERVVITVEDDGPGIPRSEREKVFDPFYRIEGSRNPDTGGVGLGLAVTRSIIWEHGGDISLASRKGGGLSVHLALPAGPGPNSPDQEKVRSSG